MNRFVRIVIWVLFFIALIIVIAYFLPQKIDIERSAVVEASPKTVYAQLVDLHSWEMWSEWNRMDPDMKVEYQNHGVGRGSGYSWESQNRKVGGGSLEIVGAEKLRSVDIRIDFMEQGSAESRFNLSAAGEFTRVKWSLSYDTGYNPFARWMGLMMDRSVGRDFEQGLANLNVWCKALETEGVPVVMLEEVGAFHFAGIREKVPYIEISLKMGEMYAEIGRYLAEKGAEMSGMPYSRYHLMSEDEIDLECGIPTDILVESEGKIMAGTFPDTQCATLDFYGDYRRLEEGHDALQRWISKRGFELAGPPMEMYLTDPGTEPDPEKWLTRICYPVE